MAIITHFLLNRGVSIESGLGSACYWIQTNLSVKKGFFWWLIHCSVCWLMRWAFLWSVCSVHI